MTSKLFILLLLHLAFAAVQVEGKCEQEGDLRQILFKMEDGSRDASDKALACLMRVGDRKINELIRLLDDDDPRVSRLAQLSLRYLANSSGMKGLYHWYSKQARAYPIIGPTPIPLSEWDYRYIEVNMLNAAPEKWESRAVSYIYALALDNSEPSQSFLEKLKVKARTLALVEGSIIAAAFRHIDRIKPCGVADEKNILRLSRQLSFFIEPDEWKDTSIKLIGKNMDETKVLVELYSSSGPLAENWRHIMIVKEECGWRTVWVWEAGIS